MEFWDIIKWVLILFLALPLLMIPLSIYSGFWLSFNIFRDFKDWKLDLSNIEVPKKRVALILAFVLIGAWGIRGNMDKAMYSRHISEGISYDYRDFADRIIRNHNIYEDILSRKEISLWQMDYLIESNEYLGTHYQKYNSLAYNFKRNDYLNHYFPSESRQIAWYMDSFKMNNIFDLEIHENRINIYHDFPIEGSDAKKFELMHKLNQLWVDVIIDNIEGAILEAEHGNHIDHEVYHNKYGERSLKDDFWIDVLSELDEVTSNFIFHNGDVLSWGYRYQ